MTTPEDLLTGEMISLNSDAGMMRLVGEVDISSAHVLNAQFKNVVERNLRNVIIDATGVTFMDSTGLHALVEGKRLLHDSGTRIVLVPSRQVRRVLELVFPDPLFAARVETLDEAMAFIAQDVDQTPA